MKDLRIVIPAYNEELTIGEVVDRVKKACPEAEVVVIDNGSHDRTGELARRKNVNVISVSPNVNYGGALKIGFKSAFESNSSIKYLAFLDADGTYPPEKIPELYNLCNEGDYDVAVGSRLLGRNEGMPFIRNVGNRLFALLARAYTGRKVSDVGSGLRVFRPLRLAWVQNLSDGMNFTPQMTMKALFEGVAYIEIPVEYDKRESKSNLNIIRDGYRFLRVILTTTKTYRPKRYYLTLGLPFQFTEFIIEKVARSRLGNG